MEIDRKLMIEHGYKSGGIMQNFNEKINLIWQIAETLRGIYKPEKYGDIILPLCVIRRFDCILENKKEEVLEIYEEYKDLSEEAIEEVMLAELEERLGINQKFYNISPFTLEKLLNDSENIKPNFEDYLNGFSENVRDIIQHFDFKKEIEKLSKNNALYNTIKEFSKVDFYKPMRKSLGSKRKEISDAQIEDIQKIYAEFQEGEYCKIFDNSEFGFRKVTVERPLKLKFQVTPEKIEELKNQTQFINIAVSKKKKEDIKAQEEAEGRKQQEELIKMLQSFDNSEIFMNRDKFLKVLKKKIKEFNLDFVKGALLKTIWQTIGERDEEAEVCKDSRGNIEPDTSLRDTETIPLKDDIQEYFKSEVLPHVPDAYLDESTFDKIGYEIPFTRYFYKYEELRPFQDIMLEIEILEKEIQEDIKAVLG